jgi:hypothetical protein
MAIAYVQQGTFAWQNLSNIIMALPQPAPEPTLEAFPGDEFRSESVDVNSFVVEGRERGLEVIKCLIDMHFLDGIDEWLQVCSGSGIVTVGDTPGKLTQGIEQVITVHETDVIIRARNTAWSIEPLCEQESKPQCYDTPLVVRTYLSGPFLPERSIPVQVEQ